MSAQVDIVIVSCSCFGPTPSLAAMVVNHFDMRESTLTYNLGGMGCSSSVIAVDLAKHLLTVRAWIDECKWHIRFGTSSIALRRDWKCTIMRHSWAC